MNFSFNFNGLSKMFEVIGRNKYARRAFYVALTSAVLLMTIYRLPEIITAFSV